MTSCTELADYHWLTGPDAEPRLRELANCSEPLHTLAERLRRDLSAARCHLLLDQVELRRRATAKFSHAERMFFTRIGLEQATDEWVAAHKARRFAGSGTVADICCGIGGDLLAIGDKCDSVGIDLDPIATHLAEANAHSLGISSTVECCEAAAINPCDFACWHIDPDRRPTGKRTSSLEWSSPSRDEIERLLAAAPNGAIKLAPAADVPDDWQQRCELDWISRDGECRQLVAWHGDLARHAGCRCATILSSDCDEARVVVGSQDETKTFTDRLDRYLFEPDAAVLAARLGGALAAEFGLAQISAGIAYLTGPHPIDDPAVACFEIQDVLPLEIRQIAAHLHESNIGRLEIKKRGVDLDPQVVRKQLRPIGDDSATLVLTKLNGKHVAIVAHRVRAANSDAPPPPVSRILHPSS